MDERLKFNKQLTEKVNEDNRLDFQKKKKKKKHKKQVVHLNRLDRRKSFTQTDVRSWNT